MGRIQFYTRPEFPFRAVRCFELAVSKDPPRYEESGLDTTNFVVVGQEKENRKERVEVNLPARPVQMVRMRIDDLGLNWEIAELEVFGAGFIAEASYTSDILDFGDIASWGKIRWAGSRDPDGEVVIRTRSGSDEEPNVYWRKTGVGDEISNTTQTGKSLTKKDYDKLFVSERGPITYDIEHWSFWSPPYDFDAGQQGLSVVSPSSRFFQVRIEFASTPTDGAWLDSLMLAYSLPPAAQQVVAEIWPVEVEPAARTTFTYALRPIIREADTGFNSLEIFTLTQADTVQKVSIDGLEINLDAFSPEIQEDRLIVHFPRLDHKDTFRLLEVILDVAVVRYGTEFKGWVFDAGTEEAPQLAKAGDATFEYAGNTLAVATTALGGSPLVSVEVTPNPFTPNKDGVNDVVVFSYSLLNLTRRAEVSIALYDLSGKVRSGNSTRERMSVGSIGECGTDEIRTENA